MAMLLQQYRRHNDQSFKKELKVGINVFQSHNVIEDSNNQDTRQGSQDFTLSSCC